MEGAGAKQRGVTGKWRMGRKEEGEDDRGTAGREEGYALRCVLWLLDALPNWLHDALPNLLLDALPNRLLDALPNWLLDARPKWLRDALPNRLTSFMTNMTWKSATGSPLSLTCCTNPLPHLLHKTSPSPAAQNLSLTCCTNPCPAAQNSLPLHHCTCLTPPPPYSHHCYSCRGLPPRPLGQGAVWSMQVSRDGKLLATGGQDGVVRVWSLWQYAK